ncbi:MAG: glycosyltransferase family 39 protein, partial [Bacteroidia bacterium]|nr:glycosyltransferase family 39 protein [Bacteroidia bacterium]
MFNLSKGAHISLIIVLGSLLFFPFLGSVHLFDWDEVNFAECAREMIASGDYSNVKINYQPFWEKPPLFIWMQVASMKLFGINEFAARFPNAVCGIVTLLVIYLIGSKTHDKKFGIFWVMAYVGSFLPHIYFKSGIIDPWFNLFIFLAIYQAILHTNNPNGKYGMQTAVLAGLFVGLATLTKGPGALLIFGLCAGVFWIRKKFAKVSSIKFLLVFILVFLITAGSWFLYEILTGNLQVLKDFFDYQIRLIKTKDAGHGGFFGYHFVILLFGCFPASVFAIRAWKKSSSDTPFHAHMKNWMNNLFWVVLIFFSLVVETKIVHYSSLCYFPMTWLAAYSLHKLSEKEFEWKKWMTYTSVVISLAFGILIIAVALIEKIKPFLLEPGRIKDQFAADCLRENVSWQGWEWIPGLFFICASLFFIYKISKGKTG